MLQNDDAALTVFREIRQEIRGTNARLDETIERVDGISTRLDGTNARLDETIERVDGISMRLDGTNAHLGNIEERFTALGEQLEAFGRRQLEGEMRLGTEVAAVARTMAQVRDLLPERQADRFRIDDHERRITALEEKVT